jgi:hypothetical protein
VKKEKQTCKTKIIDKCEEYFSDWHTGSNVKIPQKQECHWLRFIIGSSKNHEEEKN